MGSWSTHSSSSFYSNRAGSVGGARGWSSSHACQRSCRCNSGGCRCSGACRGGAPRALGWSVPAPPPIASFDDAGVRGEVGRYRRPMAASRRPVVARGGWNRGGGGIQRGGWQSGSVAGSSGRTRWSMAMGRVRVAQSNARWARRLGWGRHAARIARALGGRSANPWSSRFADAIARWQRRSGFRATGILAPREWFMLRRRLRIGVAPVASMSTVAPVFPQPTFPDPSMPDPSTSIEPQAGMDGDGDGVGEPPNEPAVEPGPAEPPMDDAGSEGNGTAPEGEWYELVRWAAP
jgi:hypothetical protein